MNRITLAANKYFRDKDGRVVLAQWPNIPLWGWLICTGLSLVFKNSWLHDGLSSLGTAFLFLWAYWEVTDGVTYFRRTLGAIILAVIVWSYFR